jgi:hypothetical protein
MLKEVSDILRKGGVRGARHHEFLCFAVTLVETMDVDVWTFSVYLPMSCALSIGFTKSLRKA